uniref:Uncharacterized protein n=1 Tax=Arundo donax TaxID=35708 RepID=A0A0A9AUF8_ARUDO
MSDLVISTDSETHENMGEPD